MSSILEQISSQRNLDFIWREMWRSRSKKTPSTSGVDSETFEKFNSNARGNIADISNHLKSGYTFSDLRAAPIPKDNSGKYRIICVPTVRDRIVQRAIGQELEKRFDRFGINNTASFGFLKSSEKAKKGVKPAVEELCRLRPHYPWAFKSDIEKYFDRINREDLISRLVKRVQARSLHEILIRAVNCEIRLEKGFTRRVVEGEGIKSGKGIRQGMPLSPLFANFQLADFDKHMLASNFKLIRYADDFVVLAKTKAECEEAAKRSVKLLSEIGHTLPPLGKGSKTKICGPQDELDFLGYQIHKTGSKYAAFVSDSKIEKMEADILQLADVSALLKAGKNFTNFGQSIDAKASGFIAAFRLAHNNDNLTERISAATKGARERVLVSLFGSQCLEQLSDDQRKFLGV